MENNKKLPMSQTTYDRLVRQSRQLEQQFSEVVKSRGEAAEGGDWHDNAVFDHLDQETNLVSARLARIQEQIGCATIIEPPTRATHVALGTEVTIEFTKDDRESFLILGPADSDPDKGIISHETPLVRALLGKRPGEEASLVVDVPGSRSETKMRVINVKPGKF